VLASKINNKYQTEADVELHVKKIVRDFGGMTACARLLTDHGCPITADGVDKWRRRGSIPTRSLIALTKIAHKRRQRFDLLDYIDNGEKKNGT